MLGSRKKAAEAAGISTDQLARYINGVSQPALQPIAKLCDAAGVGLEWLVTGEGEPTAQATAPTSTDEDGADSFADRYALVPLYDVRVSAGHGAFADSEKVLTQLAFTRYWLHKLGLHAAHLAAVRVDGDSMEPTIRSGDVLLLDRAQTHPRDGAIYVMRRDDWLVAKRVQLLAGGRVRVISDNPAYPPEEVAPEQLDLLGRVVWKGGPI